MAEFIVRSTGDRDYNERVMSSPENTVDLIDGETCSVLAFKGKVDSFEIPSKSLIQGFDKYEIVYRVRSETSDPDGHPTCGGIVDGQVSEVIIARHKDKLAGYSIGDTFIRGFMDGPEPLYQVVPQYIKIHAFELRNPLDENWESIKHAYQNGVSKSDIAAVVTREGYSLKPDSRRIPLPDLAWGPGSPYVTE